MHELDDMEKALGSINWEMDLLWPWHYIGE